MATIKYTVRASVPDDAAFLRGKLRAADYAEVLASSGRSADEMLLESLSYSRKAWTGCVWGVPFVMFGVAARSRLSLRGTPWLLGTEQVDNAGLAVVRRSRHTVAEMLAEFPMLENFTDDRHKSAHQWLRWSGFLLDEPAPWGVGGLPFRRFHLGD